MLGDNISIVGNVISATGGTGGTTNYNLLGNKPSINGVILQGDKSFGDLGLETSKKYTQFDGTKITEKYFNTEFKFINDIVPVPTSDLNCEYYYIAKEDLLSNRFRIRGTGGDNAVYFTCTENPSQVSSSDVFKSFSNQNTYSELTEITIEIPEEANYLVFNFVDTDSLTPSIEYITETIGGTTNYNNLDNKPQINGVTLQGNKSWADLGLVIEQNYQELGNYVVGKYFNLSIPSFVGDIVLAPTDNANSKIMILNKEDLNSNKFRITGYSGNYIYFFTDNDPLSQNIATIKGLSSSEIGYDEEELTLDFPEGANYLIFNFTNTNETTPKVEIITESFNTEAVTKLSSNVILNSDGTTTPELNTGFYYTDSYKVGEGDIFGFTKIHIYDYQLFYYDKNEKTFICNNYQFYYSNLHMWETLYNPLHLPSLNQNLVISTSPIEAFDTGFYYTGSYGIYFNSVSEQNKFIGSNQIFYFDYDSQSIWSPFENALFDDDNNLWDRYQNDYIENSLTNSRGKLPTSHAVYEAIQNISPSGSSFYTELTQNISLTDGTAPTLEEGWYYTGNFRISVNGNVEVNNKEFIYVYNDTSLTMIYCFEKMQTNLKKSIYYSNSTTLYDIQSLNISGVTQIIDSSSTTTQVASAKAIFDTLLKITSGQATKVSAVQTDQTNFYKSGKFVIATINFQLSSQVSTNGLLYTDNPYPPSTETGNCRGMVLNTSGSSWCVNIRTNGEIAIMDRNISAGWYNGFALYITD